MRCPVRPELHFSASNHEFFLLFQLIWWIYKYSSYYGKTFDLLFALLFIVSARDWVPSCLFWRTLSLRSRILLKIQNQAAGYYRHIFRPDTKSLINNWKQLKRRLQFKIKFSKVFYKHQIPPLISIFFAKDFVQNIFVSGPKNFVGERFGVSENIGYGKVLCIRKGCHLFRLKLFCLTLPKKSVGERFLCFEKFLASKIFMHRRGASRFCLTVSKKFVGETFDVVEIFQFGKKIWMRGGLSRFSVGVYLPHIAEKHCGGTLRCCRNVLVSKIFLEYRGIRILSNFFVWQCRKISW